MSIVNEIWKDIPDYEGYYQVSNLGRVRSCDRVVSGSRKGTPCDVKRKGRTLKPNFKRGYLGVSLFSDGCAKTYTVHRLVAQAFIGDRPLGFVINHKDGDRQNNAADNLEYCTQQENVAHAYRIGLCENHFGDLHHGSKLTSEDIPVIRNRILKGDTHKSIAKDYGVDRSTIGLVNSGRNWAHIQ
jgi:hypothetical protein